MTFNPVNLLRAANALIPTVEVETREYESTRTDEAGRRIRSYGPWTRRMANVQPGELSTFGTKKASEREYDDAGMKWARSNITVYAAWRPRTSSECRAPSQVRWDGRVFTCVSRIDWHGYSGWTAGVFTEEKGAE